MAKRGRQPRKHEHQLGDFWLGKRPKSSNWYIMWSSKKSGRVERLSTGTANLEEAKGKLAEHFLVKQQLVDERPENVTLIAVLKHYYDQHGQNVRSKVAIDRSIELLGEFWPTESISDVTLEAQARFSEWMRERGNSSGYTKRVIGVMGTALRWAHSNRHIQTMPAILKPTYFGADVERDRILTLDELVKLWDTKMPDHIRTFLVLSLCTAARPEALLQLRKAQIDFDQRLIHLNPKGRIQTKKYRPTLPICNTLLPWLSMDRDIQVSWRKNQKEPIKSIKTSWRKLRKDVGLDSEVVPYTLRHTVATELRKRGVPEWECQGFMGHRSGGVTERYAKYQPDHLGACTQAIDELCGEIHAEAKTPLVLATSIITRQKRATAS